VSADRFRTLISIVLIVGVAISASLLAIAVAGALLVGWHGSLLGYPPTDTPATDFAGMIDGLAALRPVAIGQAGLLVLIATPVARVAASAGAFALEGDRLYVAITLTVLTILLVSLLVLH
jgi:uncharacterized membrane protein